MLCLVGYIHKYSIESKPAFRRNISPIFSRYKNKPSRKPVRTPLASTDLFQPGLWLELFYDSEDGGFTFLHMATSDKSAFLGH
jgi:hypothetical protein